MAANKRKKCKKDKKAEKQEDEWIAQFLKLEMINREWLYNKIYSGSEGVLKGK